MGDHPFATTDSSLYPKSGNSQFASGSGHVNVPNLPFLMNKEVKSSVKRVHVYRELCGPEGVVLQQNNILQQVTQEVHHDSNLHGT